MIRLEATSSAELEWTCESGCGFMGTVLTLSRLLERTRISEISEKNENNCELLLAMKSSAMHINSSRLIIYLNAQIKIGSSGGGGGGGDQICPSTKLMTSSLYTVD